MNQALTKHQTRSQLAEIDLCVTQCVEPYLGQPGRSGSYRGCEGRRYGQEGGWDTFGVKLLTTIDEEYRKAYDLGRDKEVLRTLERQLLATPFAEPKKIKRTYAIPDAKKLGRPAKGSK